MRNMFSSFTYIYICKREKIPKANFVIMHSKKLHWLKLCVCVSIYIYICDSHVFTLRTHTVSNKRSRLLAAITKFAFGIFSVHCWREFFFSRACCRARLIMRASIAFWDRDFLGFPVRSLRNKFPRMIRISRFNVSTYVRLDQFYE